MKASPTQLVTMQSENWHVKRDEKPYHTPIEDKAKVALASLE